MMLLWSILLYIAMIFTLYLAIYIDSWMKHERVSFDWFCLLVAFLFWPCLVFPQKNTKELRCWVFSLLTVLLFHSLILAVNHLSAISIIVLVVVGGVWGAASGALEWIFNREVEIAVDG